MKVLIIGFGNTKYMPYLNFYLNNIPFDDITIFTWDRDKTRSLELEDKYKFVYFNQKITNDKNFFFKISSFYKYRKSLLLFLKHNNFDRVIILHTPPAFLIYKFLIKNYKFNFLIDYRDITYEKNYFFRFIINKIISKSYATFISSLGFKKFLSDRQFFITHNIDLNLVNNINNYHNRLKVGTKRIVIRFWGQIRHLNYNIHFINKLSLDDRFELHFHGTNNNTFTKLFNYSKSKKLNNVFFHGEYIPDNRIQFSLNTDLIHNSYDVGKTEQYAMGNKYYDGAIFGIPQICNKFSHMGKRIVQDGLGISIDIKSKDFLNQIYEYFINLDRISFNRNCLSFIEKCMNEQEIAKEKISSFFK
jgi:hypothetical protein